MKFPIDATNQMINHHIERDRILNARALEKMVKNEQRYDNSLHTVSLTCADHSKIACKNITYAYISFIPDRS